MDASAFESHFQSAVESRGDAYVKARDKILEQGPGVLPLLEAEIKSGQGWRPVLTARVLKGWITDKSAYERCTSFAKGDYPFRGPGRPVSGEHGAPDRAGKIHSLGVVVIPRILEMMVMSREYEGQVEAGALMSSLVSFRDPETIPPVLEMARDQSEDVFVRVLAVTLLGEFDRADTKDALLELATGEGGPDEVRGAAAAKLAELKDDRVLKPVDAILASDEASEDLKLDALMALSELADARGVPMLDRLLRKEKSEVLVQTAVETLGEIGDSSSIALLEKVRKDHSDEDILEAVKEAIEAIRARP